MTALDTAADELYAIAPAELDEFGRRRSALAAALKQAGDKDTARRVGSLRKPVLAAAIANALMRSGPAELAELAELGVALRDAHRHLRGPELRELSEKRQQLLNRLTELGRAVAGRPVGEPVLDQLRATFEAAIADEAAEAAVRSGRLTAALSYSGFGEVDLADAVALPPRLTIVPDLAGDEAPSRSRKSSPDRKKPRRSPAPEEADADEAAAEAEPAGPDPAELRRANQALERAESAAAAARRAADEAADELAAADAAEREIDERIRQLKAELAEARDAATSAASASSAAEREHGRRVRAAERAEQARERAQAELDSLG